ncbi:MAG: DUF721 domain-containing protein [Cuspidothrix sp.]
MSFKSIDDILRSIQKSAVWEDELFPRLLKCWTEVVGPKVAVETRPISIQRDVLWVATSSAAWAQNLTFQRQTILMKLNHKLSVSLVDIRFSTAEWTNLSMRGTETTISASEHPSHITDTIAGKRFMGNSENPQRAFEDWSQMVQERSHHLPLCPQCQCPTPPGELQRWGVCSLCGNKLFR